ncbi:MULTISPECIES: branched-chain amino acid ABC transporter permease [Psychrobacillus]|uniref:Branched-chain amino acid ABC transporter permease n=1 Tax=Psychrobacillus faecigallinarum TaxID=2762235 RepID=A0ABR8RA30_9BACI|nr:MULTISPECIES: branched-chain amino acid ABC transporter permease [Psychrobacillus]MBD7944648.1 branched-chain amino acid ABC transporter permease [Psychrobacillus faecigallinarum]QEY21170.1 branched-chain amino acid ABC transporter permease [Psychrobacillus sp. AK 1817]QGM31682.1 branched-chain amino acid ABC transporter permease [Bacillus sp. N3536]
MLGEILNPYHLQIISFILINIILGISIYITLSSGQLSLGNAGFMGIGAYTSALLTINFEVPLYISIILGALVAGAFGVLIGIPALRLSGVYLAIATLGFGEVIRVIFVNWDSVTKGSVGLSGIPHLGRELFQFLRDLGFDPDMLGLKNNQAIYLIVVLVLLIITISIIWFFIRQNKSRVGRAYAAIKMDEKAAEAMGINITYYKVLSFTQGAILAGFAGALYAHVLAYISPADFAYHRAIDILIFSIFGGSEVIWGAIFGATFMTLLPEALRFISEYRYMIYGIILILLMAFRPQGIIDVPVLNWLKRTFTFKRRDSNGIRAKKYN